jgi:mercuric ion binding protein
MKNLIWILLFALPIATMAQEKESKKTETINIQTSAVCGMCEDLIVNNTLAFEKGVKYAKMDVESGMLTVRYRSDKTSAENLRAVISDLGYDADSVKADKKAYDNLHFCCKKPCGTGKSKSCSDKK